MNWKTMRLFALCMLLLFAMGTSSLAQTYSATSEGFGGSVTIEATVDDGVISGLSVTESAETPAIGGSALEQLCDYVVATQALPLEGISGATYSSDAFFAAMQTIQEESGLALEASAAEIEELSFVPGTYEATVDGYRGRMDVRVTVDEHQILAIETPVNNETVSIGTAAVELMTQEILDAQTLNVDAASGATITSGAFLSGVRACLLEAGAQPSALMRANAQPAQEQSNVIDTDIVIVGAGLAGLSSAVRATELGADVVIVEKLSIVGGSARTSLGSYLVCETPENEGYHVTEEADTLDAALERWKTYQATSLRESQYPDYDRLAYQLVQSMFTIDWLKNWGATFAPKTPIAERGMAMVQVDIPNMTQGTPAGKLLMRLRDVAVEQGASLYTDTRATELLVDENGKVTGVVCQTKDGTLTVNANSVILASGGYSENPEMIAALIPEAGECSTIGSAGNTGDGIVMAQAVGAALWENQWIHACWPGPTKEFRSVNPHALIFMDSTSPLDIAESSYYRLMVDKDGERFMNEAGHYSAQVLNMTAHGNNPFWSIYDGLEGEAADIAQSGLVTGTVIKGDTVASLAEQAGMDPAVLEATVARYNEMCVQDTDDDFGKPADHLIAIGDGPYYMIQMLPGACDTLGGVKTDYDQRVLREDGSVIDGLFAIGAMTNGVYYNQSYFSGSQLTFASTTGKIAAERALGE